MINNPSKKDFLFLPLGGSGEIGMNLNLYGYNDQWLMVDLGVTFHDRYGIDVITPDPEFISERRSKLVGLVLTHAHEDHIGAIPYLWPDLECPIYATPFTAHLVREKIKEYPWAKKVKIIEIPVSGSCKVGDFSIEFITLTHSIPEPNALAITTPLGTVMHTGDWKVDPDPLVGEPTDFTKLKEWGDRGVLAMVCDSTNVFTEGSSGSEAAVRSELIDQVGRFPNNRVVVACFASNLARVASAVVAAQIHGRKVALVGRSLDRMVKAAKASGYLDEIPPFIDERTAMTLPVSEVLLICTGSQGEARSALARMAGDQHPGIKMDHHDIVLFSSRVIPGNERLIANLQNNLARKNIRIVTSHEEEIHVSGHPARDELKMMYEVVRPKVLIPVHGELRHMREQARFGLECGVPHAVVPENGLVVQLHANPVKIADTITTVGRLGLDGNRLVPMISPLVRDRSRLSMSGVVIASLCLDRAEQLAKIPQVTMVGVCLEGQEKERVEQDIQRVIRLELNNHHRNKEALKEALRVAIRRVCNSMIGKKPLVEIHIH